MSYYELAILEASIARDRRNLAALRFAVMRAEATMCQARSKSVPEDMIPDLLDGAIAECRAALAGMAEGERSEG